MRYSGNILHFILSRWSCLGGIGIWGFETKGLLRHNFKGHFIGFIRFNSLLENSVVSRKKCIYRWNSGIKLYFKELLFFQQLIPVYF